MQRLVLGIVLLAMLSGCTGGQMTLAELKKVPGVAGTYPSASVYRDDEFEAEANLMAKNPASIKLSACTVDSRQRVTAWFHEHLTAAGWRRAPGHLSDSDGQRFPEGVAWERGALTFQLWMLAPPYADQLAKAVGQPTGCPTAYQTIVG